MCGRGTGRGVLTMMKIQFSSNTIQLRKIIQLCACGCVRVCNVELLEYPMFYLSLYFTMYFLKNLFV